MMKKSEFKKISSVEFMQDDAGGERRLSIVDDVHMVVANLCS